ncbi:MAG: DNA-binding domain-containing protein [Kofleriaceae bacterium]
MADLRTLQREFQALVVTGRGDPRGLLASGQLGIYAHAYGARLHDALATDYPKLRAALGDAEFAALAERYLAAHPPRSFTLRHLSDRLPGFLAGDAAAPPWAAELARLEQARLDAFDGPDHAALDRAALAASDPTGLPELPLAWVSSATVVPLAYTVDATWAAVEEGQPPPPPAPCARVVLVWRRDLQARHRTLEPDEAAVAVAVAGGVTFAELCGLLPGDDDVVAARAIELLLRWLDAGVLAVPSHATLTEAS